MKHCSRCNLDTAEAFCTRCGSLAKPSLSGPETPSKGAPGQTFECVIWQGQTRGIKIGRVSRKRFFSVRKSRIELVINDEVCLAELADNFWTTCPEIRVALDGNGANRLSAWIEAQGLMAPGASIRLRGKEDKVVMEVVVPEERFRVTVAEGAERNK